MAKAFCLTLVSPAACACWIEAATLCGDGQQVFEFFAHTLALMPGTPGVYLRRAFFQLTLESCAADCHIGFGSFFTSREAIAEDGVHIGCYVLIGSAVLRRGCRIESQVSVLSGGVAHEKTHDGSWSPFDPQKMHKIEVGAGSTIGEGGVVMADVGAGALISAGTVVASAVPPYVVVAGNPARFVRRFDSPAPDHDVCAIRLDAVPG